MAALFYYQAEAMCHVRLFTRPGQDSGYVECTGAIAERLVLSRGYSFFKHMYVKAKCHAHYYWNGSDMALVSGGYIGLPLSFGTLTYE